MNFENLFPPEPLSFTDAYNKRAKDSTKVKSKQMVNMCNDLGSFTVLCTIFLDIITTYDKEIEVDDMMIKEE